MSRGSSGSGNRRGDSLARWLGVLVFAGLLLLLYLALSGGKEELPTVYGKRRGPSAAESVNGTAVLAGMFEQAGHRVTTVTELSRRLESYQTIVWTPDDFGPPSDEAIKFLDAWLAASPQRTLVYVGRDYDAAPQYWQQMLSTVDDPRHDEYQRRLAHAASTFDQRRTEMPDQKDCGWFVMLGGLPARKIPDLDGPWSKGVDASKTDIVLAGRLDIPTPANLGTEIETTEVEVLLQSENDILAHRYTQSWWNSSQVIVVANGSFLLNLPLVNKEHRKLAGHLITECGPPGAVAFVESGPMGVTVRQGTPIRNSMLAHRILTIWPMIFVLLHFSALGIVFCFSVFPIFGRPHRLPSEARSDFGKHVAAFGELLARTKDSFFAESRIRTYQTQAKRGSGQAHRVVIPNPSSSPPAAEPITIASLATPTAPSTTGNDPKPSA
jgi:hypothetical protein